MEIEIFYLPITKLQAGWIIFEKMNRHQRSKKKNGVPISQNLSMTIITKLEDVVVSCQWTLDTGSKLDKESRGDWNFRNKLVTTVTGSLKSTEGGNTWTVREGRQLVRPVNWTQLQHIFYGIRLHLESGNLLVGKRKSTQISSRTIWVVVFGILIKQST